MKVGYPRSSDYVYCSLINSVYCSDEQHIDNSEKHPEEADLYQMNAAIVDARIFCEAPYTVE